MSVFDDEEFNNEKQCVYEWMLQTEPIDVLKEFLMFEDLCVGGFVPAFPGKIAFKWETLLEEEARREAKNIP